MKLPHKTYCKAYHNLQTLLPRPLLRNIFSLIKAPYYHFLNDECWEVDERAHTMITNLASPYYRAFYKMYLLQDEIDRNCE